MEKKNGGVSRALERGQGGSFRYQRTRYRGSWLGWFARRQTSVVICKNRRPIAISELGRCLPISVQQPCAERIDGGVKERKRKTERERGQSRCTTGVG